MSLSRLGVVYVYHRCQGEANTGVIKPNKRPIWFFIALFLSRYLLKITYINYIANLVNIFLLDKRHKLITIYKRSHSIHYRTYVVKTLVNF